MKKFTSTRTKIPQTQSCATSCDSCNSCSSAKPSLPTIFISLAIVIVIVSLTHIFSIPTPQFATISVGVALVLGLIASLSTCLATTGGLLLAINPQANKTITSAFIVGRIVSYSLVGFLLGYLGQTVSISAKTTSILVLIVGAVLIYIGLHQLLQWSYPRFFSSIFSSATAQTKTASLSGALTVLIPCSFTQLVQVAVVVGADPFVGALLLGAFAVGSIPGLVVVGLAPRIVPATLFSKVTTFLSVAVVCIGAFTLYSAVVWQIPVAFTESAQQFNATVQDSQQQLQMKITGLEYHPNEFQLQAGMQTTWVIDATQAVGCARSLTVPGLGISQFLGNGVSTITFTPQKSGVFSFSCSMGMAGPGKLVVE
jgi:uncharacterized protein